VGDDLARRRVLDRELLLAGNGLLHRLLRGCHPSLS
jgi:hypothetical protein